jgi:thiol-disulfide isomerase/thioredoxin
MAGAERPALIGHQAPEVKGRYVNGDQFDLSKLKGDIVVLDFWATWCGPCAEEMASLEQLKNSLSAKKVVFVSVTDDSPEKVKRWMVERKRSLPTATVAPETCVFVLRD